MHFTSRPALEDRVTGTRARDRLTSRRSRIRPESGRASPSGGEDSYCPAGTHFRILAPDFLTFMSNRILDLKHPLTIFDETPGFGLVAVRAGPQEDLGASWARPSAA